MSSLLDTLLSLGAAVLRVPGRASHAAKLEHLLCLYLGYVAVRKVAEVGPKGLLSALLANVVRAARKVPGVSGAVEKEQAEILGKIKDMVLGDRKDEEPPNRALPDEGMPADTVLAKITAMRSKESKYLEGYGMGGIYHVDGDDLSRLQTATFGVYNCSNALYPGIFPAVRKFEAEVVRMIVTMVNGDEKACGTLTSGGTESVLMAVLAYREWGRSKGITRPEIVAGVNAHAALEKAAHYFNVKLVYVPHDDQYHLSVPHAKRAVNRNTVAIYASAPSFPHGTVDDIEALSEIALSRGIGLHVDNCLGGFLLSYMVKEGLSNRAFDFKVPGVTSMSIDVHKYGMASKGASCVVYRSPDLRRCQYTAVANWSGGLYCTPTMQGSRSGAVMATAWATLMHKGDSGYRKIARNLGNLHARLKREIAAIPGLKLMGNPDACVVAYSSDDFNIYVLADEMTKRGWEVPRLQRPPCVHFCVGDPSLMPLAKDRSKTVADQYLDDLREAAKICMDTRNDSSKAKEGMAGIYGMAGSLPDRTIVTDLLSNYMDVLYMVE